MNNERNKNDMKQSNGETTVTVTETKTDEKRDEIDREFYTEHGGEG